MSGDEIEESTGERLEKGAQRYKYAFSCFITPRIFIGRGMSLSRAACVFIAFIFSRTFFSFLPILLVLARNACVCRSSDAFTRFHAEMADTSVRIYIYIQL